MGILDAMRAGKRVPKKFAELPQHKLEAMNYIQNFKPRFEDVEAGFDLDLPSLFFRQIERINFSMASYPEQFKNNVDVLEKMASPHADAIWQGDLKYINYKKNLLLKKLQSKYPKLNKKVYAAMDMMIAKEKYTLIMFLFSRIGIFPMKRGTLILDTARYIKLRDAFFTYYTSQPIGDFVPEGMEQPKLPFPQKDDDPIDPDEQEADEYQEEETFEFEDEPEFITRED